jgi:hypothetical protein
LPTRVKIEPDSTQLQIIKQEAIAFINLSNDFHSASQVWMRTVVENGTETIEILSDTEDKLMGDDDGLDLDWDMHASSDTLIADPESISSDDDLSDGEDAVSSDFESSEEPELDVSTTQWLDPEIKSQVSNQPRRLNRQLLVERVEYLSEIPTYWPVPHQKTAYILDLRDPKFDVVHDKGELLSVDALIKNKVCPNTTVSPSSVYIYLCCFHRIRIHGQVGQVEGTQSLHLTFSLENPFHAAVAVSSVRDFMPVVTLIPSC